MKVIGGSASEALADKVARELGVKPTPIEAKKFPDGEKYLRVMDDVRGQDVVVIQSMYKTPDEYLIEYFLLVDNLKSLGTRRVISFIPYFAYARQDSRFNPGEALSIVTVSKLIQDVGTDELYAFDAHLHRISEMVQLFKVPAHDLTAMPVLARYVLERFSPNHPLVIGPDRESETQARAVADVLKTDFDVLVKKRLAGDRVETQSKQLNASGRDVVIADDIISTGGTIVEAIKIVRAQGAGKIYVACTHPLLIGNALAKILEQGADAVVGTDTVPSPVSQVSVAPLIANRIRELGLR
jgi:ribose-phosphate pyrophosphokinase